MANDAGNRLIYARIAREDAALLAAGYAHSHWQLAAQGNFVWVKNILEEETNSVLLRRIPSLRLLEQVKDALHPLGSLLLWGPVPVLDWSPLQEAIQLQLPDANANYLGLQERLTPEVVPSAAPQTAEALRVSFEVLSAWVEKAPAWRLEALEWTLLDNGHALEALLIGTPLPPLNGQSYWRDGRSLLPLGYALSPSAWGALLAAHIGERHYWLWNTQGQYTHLSASLRRPLTRSSVRHSAQQPPTLAP